MTYYEKIQEINRLFGPFSFLDICLFHKVKEWVPKIIDNTFNEVVTFFVKTNTIKCYVKKHVEGLKPI